MIPVQREHSFRQREHWFRKFTEKCSRSTRNHCSRSIGTGVHVRPESVFTFIRNMQLNLRQ